MHRNGPLPQVMPYLPSKYGYHGRAYSYTVLTNNTIPNIEMITNLGCFRVNLSSCSASSTSTNQNHPLVPCKTKPISAIFFFYFILSFRSYIISQYNYNNNLFLDN